MKAGNNARRYSPTNHQRSLEYRFITRARAASDRMVGQRSATAWCEHAADESTIQQQLIERPDTPPARRSKASVLHQQRPCRVERSPHIVVIDRLNGTGTLPAATFPSRVCWVDIILPEAIVGVQNITTGRLSSLIKPSTPQRSSLTSEEKTSARNSDCMDIDTG
jgi:hypothetical protein